MVLLGSALLLFWAVTLYTFRLDITYNIFFEKGLTTIALLFLVFLLVFGVFFVNTSKFDFAFKDTFNIAIDKIYEPVMEELEELGLNWCEYF